jgi:transposase InsO family protein
MTTNENLWVEAGHGPAATSAADVPVPLSLASVTALGPTPTADVPVPLSLASVAALGPMPTADPGTLSLNLASVTALGPTPAVETFTAAHLERLQQIAGLPHQSAPGSKQRGFGAQQVLRELEQAVRLGVLDFCQQATAQGWSRSEAAALLNLVPRTVRFWDQARRQGTFGVRPRGRPLTAAEPDQLNAVVALLQRLGPATGLAVLQGEFPGLARAELHDLLACYRQAWQGHHPRLVHVLHWQVPGRIWAMDYAQAPCLIDGCCGYVLAVRDLASGQQLLWLPMTEATVASTIEALASLFDCYGPPLVLKSDNGSAFCAELMETFLHRHGVQALFSPPRTPEYNGSCEAAIGAHKKRTAYEAERQGHG